MIAVTDGVLILFHFIILHLYRYSRKTIISPAKLPGFAFRYPAKCVIESERDEDLSFCSIVMKRG